jgi:hypothetical protein
LPFVSFQVTTRRLGRKWFKNLQNGSLDPTQAVIDRLAVPGMEHGLSFKGICSSATFFF